MDECKGEPQSAKTGRSNSTRRQTSVSDSHAANTELNAPSPYMLLHVEIQNDSCI